MKINPNTVFSRLKLKYPNLVLDEIFHTLPPFMDPSATSWDGTLAELADVCDMPVAKVIQKLQAILLDQEDLERGVVDIAWNLDKPNVPFTTGVLWTEVMQEIGERTVGVYSSDPTRAYSSAMRLRRRGLKRAYVYTETEILKTQ